MRAGIALGSNLGERLANLRSARSEVARLSGVLEVCGSSPVYETEPVDCEPGTPGFLNAVIIVEYERHPVELLDALQTVEALLGRPKKRPRNAPRPIDLDVLFAGNIVLNNEEIIIPHPRLHLRKFVLQPLADLLPDLLLPGQSKPVAALLAEVEDPTEVVKVVETW